MRFVIPVVVLVGVVRIDGTRVETEFWSGVVLIKK
jgi:hypothetical protein